MKAKRRGRGKALRPIVRGEAAEQDPAYWCFWVARRVRENSELIEQTWRVQGARGLRESARLAELAKLFAAVGAAIRDTRIVRRLHAELVDRELRETADRARALLRECLADGRATFLDMGKIARAERIVEDVCKRHAGERPQIADDKRFRRLLADELVKLARGLPTRRAPVGEAADRVAGAYHDVYAWKVRRSRRAINRRK